MFNMPWMYQRQPEMFGQANYAGAEMDPRASLGAGFQNNYGTPNATPAAMSAPTGGMVNNAKEAFQPSQGGALSDAAMDKAFPVGMGAETGMNTGLLGAGSQMMQASQPQMGPQRMQGPGQPLGDAQPSLYEFIRARMAARGY